MSIWWLKVYLTQVTLDEIKTLTINNEVIKLLYESIKTGTLDCVKYPQLTCFSRVFNELSIVNGIIIKGEKILVPSNLRQRVLSAEHDGHQGLEKTKGILRSKIWYPGIDKEIRELVRNCRGCQSAVNYTYREPLLTFRIRNAPYGVYGKTETHQMVFCVLCFVFCDVGTRNNKLTIQGLFLQ